MDPRYDSGYNYGPGNRLRGASVVKILIILNSAVYLVELFAQYRGTLPQMQRLLAMVPQLITEKLYVWQFLTAMFMHGDFFHIFFNMLTLFFFGPELEWMWGKRRFTVVYFAIGIGANLFAYLLDIHTPVPTLGASGAILGLLGAYAAIYPNRMIIFMIFPIKVKWLVAFYFVFSLLATAKLEASPGTASAVHLAGIVLGVLYVKLRWDRLSFSIKHLTSRVRFWYLKRKYRNLKIADEILVDDDQKNRWDRYKQ